MKRVVIATYINGYDSLFWSGTTQSALGSLRKDLPGGGPAINLENFFLPVGLAPRLKDDCLYDGMIISGRQKVEDSILTKSLGQTTPSVLTRVFFSSQASRYANL